jgi:hypothetical protein
MRSPRSARSQESHLKKADSFAEADGGHRHRRRHADLGGSCRGAIARRARGLTFVRVHCAQCHSIDTASESTLKIAPPFRDLHRKGPIESLRRPLSEGIIANHPTMPQFRLEADQVNDVIAFMQSLER